MLYSFECKKCNKKEDRLVKMADADTQNCECGEHMDRVVDFSTSFQLKGRWMKTAGSY